MSVPSEVDQRLVDESLVIGFDAGHLVVDVVEDRLDGILHALAQVALRITVAQFDCFELTRRGAGRHTGAAHGAVFEEHFDFDGRIATGVEDLPCGYGQDLCHGFSLIVRMCACAGTTEPA